MSVDGTLLTKSFTLFNLTIAGNGTSSSTGIVLNHINPSGQQTTSAAVKGVQTSIQGNGIEIVVENSSYVMLDGGGANRNGAGISSSNYNNTIKNNLLSSNAGADLVWAQVVLDPSSPIGIAAEPPFIHCNVTVSEGGGGVANQNGNVWSGNTAKHIDPCITPQ